MGSTMSEVGHFSRYHFLTPQPLPTRTAPWWWCVRRPWGLGSQTSGTKSVATSTLKHLNGHPLSTASTCLSLMVRYEVLVYGMPRPPSHPTSSPHRLAPSSRRSKGMILFHQFFEISNALAIPRLKSSQEQGLMVFLSCRSREPCATAVLNG